MAKKAPNVQQVLDQTKTILASNNGKILYSKYRELLNEALPDNDQALSTIIKRKLMYMWLDAADSGKEPVLYVVSELPKG